MIKFIEISGSGASWARPWKIVSLCKLWGWPRPHLHNKWYQDLQFTFDWIPDEHGHFWECACETQILIEMERPRWVRVTLNFDLVHERLFWRSIFMPLCDLYWTWISIIKNKHPVDISTQGTSCVWIPSSCLSTMLDAKPLTTWFIVNIQYDYN